MKNQDRKLFKEMSQDEAAKTYQELLKKIRWDFTLIKRPQPSLN